jgi:hypothetical protein
MPAAVLASTAVAAAGGPAAARDVQRVLANHAGPRQAGGAAHPNKACPAPVQVVRCLEPLQRVVGGFGTSFGFSPSPL